MEKRNVKIDLLEESLAAYNCSESVIRFVFRVWVGIAAEAHCYSKSESKKLLSEFREDSLYFHCEALCEAVLASDIETLTFFHDQLYRNLKSQPNTAVIIDDGFASIYADTASDFMCQFIDLQIACLEENRSTAEDEELNNAIAALVELKTEF